MSAGLRRHMGLVFETARPVGVPHTCSSGVDVTVGEGAEASPDPLQGELVAHFHDLGVDYYSLFRHPSGYTLRVHTVCDFLISVDGSSVECRPFASTDPDVVSVVLAGTVTAILWMLRGRAVLHASAVLHDSKGFALVGPSGSGKSTIAALCCAAGAELLSDDLVVLEPSDNGAQCVGRAGELRLRPGMRGVTRLWPSKPLERATGDGRTAVSIPPGTSASAEERIPLGAAALLMPSSEVKAVQLTRLSGPDAVFALMAQSRVAGLADGQFNANLLTAAASVARAVPVVAAKVPWQPPFDLDSGRQILEALAGMTTPIEVR